MAWFPWRALRQNIGDRLLFQHLVPPEAVDAAMAYFAKHHIESYQWQGADGMYISEGYRQHLESKGKTWNRGEFARFWHLLDEVEVRLARLWDRRFV